MTGRVIVGPVPRTTEPVPVELVVPVPPLVLLNVPEVTASAEIAIAVLVIELIRPLAVSVTTG